MFLTVFRKTRGAEVAEVERALLAQKECEAWHGSRTRCSSERSGGMADEHASYEEIVAARRESAEYCEGYDEARQAFLVGQAGAGAAPRAGAVAG